MKRQRKLNLFVCCFGIALSGCTPSLKPHLAAKAMRPKARAALAFTTAKPLVGLEELAMLDLVEPSQVDTRQIPPEVLHFLDLFSGERREVVLEHAELSKEIEPKIAEILLEKGLPREILTIAFLESRFNPSIRSRRGDTVGMWQLEERTARRYGLIVNRNTDERKDPVKATNAAANMLIELRDHFGNWALALAAYNSGPFRVDQAIRDSGGEKSVFNLAARGLLSQTTSDYLARFAALTLILGNPGRYGFPAGSAS